MRSVYFALPFIAACLAFTGVSGQASFAAEGPGSPHPGKAGATKAGPAAGSRKILIAYFSHSGNTRAIANQIHRDVGGDLFEIQTVKPYPNDYDAVVEQAKQELASGYKPALKTKVANIRQYDVIFIGYPNWWSTVPAPVRVFLTENDLSGKTVVPFCTHGGGGLGHSISDIRKFCPGSTVLEALAVPGSSATAAQDKVSAWLRKIKITK